MGVHVKYDYFFTSDNLSIRYGVGYPKEEQIRGTILLLSGRAEFLEKYEETITDLCKRKFRVFSMDWRGQGLSDRLLPDRQKGYVETYQDYLNDLHQFIHQIVKPKNGPPFFVLAHSMGAHIALRFLYENPALFKKAVLVSPMIDIQIPFYLRKWIKAVAFFMKGLKMRGISVVDNPGYSDSEKHFLKNPLTTDRYRFSRRLKLLRKKPDLDSGKITWGWLVATFRSIELFQKQQTAKTIHTPILMVSGGLDRIVSIRAQKTFCKKTAGCTFKMMPHAKHEILMETDTIRNHFWHEFDEFINRT